MTVVYKPAEVMDMLGLKESTYKKYILELEKEGYVVQKDGRTRLFTDDDIKTLEQFMELLKYDGITISLAAKKIAEMKGKTDITEEPKSHDVMALVEVAVSTALEKQEQRFIQANKELAQEMKSEIKALGEKSEKTRVEELRLILEGQKQIAAAQEQQKEESKKGFFARLFGK